MNEFKKSLTIRFDDDLSDHLQRSFDHQSLPKATFTKEVLKAGLEVMDGNYHDKELNQNRIQLNTLSKTVNTLIDSVNHIADSIGELYDLQLDQKSDEELILKAKQEGK